MALGRRLVVVAAAAAVLAGAPASALDIVAVEDISDPGLVNSSRYIFRWTNRDGTVALSEGFGREMVLWRRDQGMVVLPANPDIEDVGFNLTLPGLLSNDGARIWQSVLLLDPFGYGTQTWDIPALAGTVLDNPPDPEPADCTNGVPGATLSRLFAASPDGLFAVGSSIRKIASGCVYNSLFTILPTGEFTEYPALASQNNLLPVAVTTDGRVILEEEVEFDLSWNYTIGVPGGEFVDHPVMSFLATIPNSYRVRFCDDGETVFVAGSQDTSPRLTRWRQSTGPVEVWPEPLLDGISFADAPDFVTPNGSSFVGTPYTTAIPFNGTPHLWRESGEVVNLMDAVNDSGFLTAPVKSLRVGSISGNGNVIFATADFDSPASFATLRIVLPDPLADTDGDGLPDEWEREGGGIDVDNDGEIDLSLFELGARPDRKDLFLEIDGTRGLFINDEVAAMVVQAFANAPVSNPSGVDGIVLHLDRSEVGIDAPEVVPYDDNVDDFPPLFDVLKAANFGTDEDRANPKRLEAKKKFVRYCLVFDRTEGGEDGMAGDIPSNDFYVCLGLSRDKIPDQDARNLEDALTLMHEFGHCLGLGHGGGDNINGKPNYPSIMNYALAFSVPFNKDFIRLDYSRVQLPPLFEDNLDETIGIGGDPEYADFRMPVGFSQASYTTPTLEFRFVTLAPLDGTPFDFGAPASFRPDGQTTQGVRQDLNHFKNSGLVSFGGSPSYPQVLNGHNDWQNLVYAVPQPQTKGGVPVRNPPEEAGYLELRAFLESIPPGGYVTPQGWSVR